ncbi:MAG: hypothetical protein GF364_08945 [Candidatus Lokiarchaeota archaeon]|nr:hypothetical protein [Candidatus Lokiarchaeota archaeon]
MPIFRAYFHALSLFFTILFGLIITSSVFYLEIGAIFYFTDEELYMIIILLVCVLSGILTAYLTLYFKDKLGFKILSIFCGFLISIGGLIYLKYLFGLYFIGFAFPGLILMILSNGWDSLIKSDINQYTVYSAVVGSILVLILYKGTNDFTNWLYILSGIILGVNSFLQLFEIIKNSEDKKPIPDTEINTNYANGFATFKTQIEWKATQPMVKILIIIYSFIIPLSILIIPVFIVSIPPIHLYNVDFSYLWVIFFEIIAIIGGYLLVSSIGNQTVKSPRSNIARNVLIWTISFTSIIIAQVLMCHWLSLGALFIELIAFVCMPMVILVWFNSLLQQVRTVWISIFQFFSLFLSLVVYIAIWAVDFIDLITDYRIILLTLVWSFILILSLLHYIINRLLEKQNRLSRQEGS